ncbi:capsular polysaccharide export protein, LipB/KpsS family [Oceanomicrobium pacificus]|uniref:Capsule polysaccharide biosynthesis protein n=1 Tax=Oceanomicrobium pacificus TaxID=2692916 RepID=A0A6B0TRL7_9RHOB|nr:hypothetical protein [Oceanomicrobium pacificus]MXU66606.1 hypothetical protein [Oceanomicrobium pacificus]
MSERLLILGFKRPVRRGLEARGLEVAFHAELPETHLDRALVPPTDSSMDFRAWQNLDRPWPDYRPVDRALYDQVRAASFETFIRCVQRRFWCEALASNWIDFEQLFAKAYAHAESLLLGRGVTAVVSANFAHEGYNNVVYAMAHVLGLPYRIFVQSPFGPRSFILTRNEDYGDLAQLPVAQDGPPRVDIAPPERPPFYMDSVHSDRKIRKKLVSGAVRTHARALGNLVSPPGLYDEWQTLKRLRERRDAARNRYFFQRMKDEAITETERLIDGPFVYFPAHLQPELTTDVLGGVYADQVRAVEELRAWMPDDVRLVVKENPKQMGVMRGRLLLDRLFRIPGVDVAARSVPSFTLTEKAIGVATVTGTAGWEALRFGKPALAMGLAFWRDFPGAWKWGDRPDWESFAGTRVDPVALQGAVDRLYDSTHDLVTDEYYKVLHPDFDDVQNNERIVDAIMAAFAA